MLLESIAYTASLLDYIRQETGLAVSEVAKRIGHAGIERLCHNAAMNKHLPESRIAHEVEYDYLSIIRVNGKTAQWNEVFGHDLMQSVEASGVDQYQYAHQLYELLVSANP